MTTVYIDEQGMCHVDNAPDRTPFQSEAFDGFCKVKIELFECHPVESGYMLRCINTNVADNCQKQYTEDCDNMMSLADVADLVELVYKDDLGIIG